jgi:hypothetical protein
VAVLAVSPSEVPLAWDFAAGSPRGEGKTMANAPGWQQDPERDDQERYWSGSVWTDRVRPAGKAGSLHLPEHVPHLHRALSAATADIDAVEDRLATLFERSDGARIPGAPPPPPPPPPTAARPAATVVADDGIPDLCGYEDDTDTDDGKDAVFDELDAALAPEEPDEPDPARRTLFRRRR